MKKNLVIRYDEEEDYLEVYFGRIQKGYFRELQDKVFERIDKKTGKIVGYAFFNVTKGKRKFLDVSVPLPKEIAA